MIWLYLSALAMAITAVIHSFAGEKRVIGPLMRSDATKILGPQLSGIMRGAWHLTSLFMVLFAVVVASPGMPQGVLIAIGSVWLAIGLAILIRSRGRHPGWPTLSVGGAFALLGAYL
jgi:hypothetical protein